MSTPHSHPETRIGTVIKGVWWTGKPGTNMIRRRLPPFPVGGIMGDPSRLGKSHYDGARDQETVVQMMGIGPTGKTTVEPGAPGFVKR